MYIHIRARTRVCVGGGGVRRRQGTGEQTCAKLRSVDEHTGNTETTSATPDPEIAADRKEAAAAARGGADRSQRNESLPDSQVLKATPEPEPEASGWTSKTGWKKARETALCSENVCQR